jgi:hypothetical protein
LAATLAGTSARAGDLSGRGETQNERFRSTMDRLFGPGHWRETGGYRTQAEENRLRAEGAGTVPAGSLSAHSLGTPSAPGAYDAVVDGMSPARAADVLRASGTAFASAFAESAHGPEGAHVHINVGGRSPFSFAIAEQAPAPRIRLIRAAARGACDSIYLRVVNQRRNPRIASCSG